MKIESQIHLNLFDTVTKNPESSSNDDIITSLLMFTSRHSKIVYGYYTQLYILFTVSSLLMHALST